MLGLIEGAQGKSQWRRSALQGESGHSAGGWASEAGSSIRCRRGTAAAVLGSPSGGAALGRRRARGKKSALRAPAEERPETDPQMRDARGCRRWRLRPRLAGRTRHAARLEAIELQCRPVKPDARRSYFPGSSLRVSAERASSARTRASSSNARNARTAGRSTARGNDEVILLFLQRNEAQLVSRGHGVYRHAPVRAPLCHGHGDRIVGLRLRAVKDGRRSPSSLVDEYPRRCPRWIDHHAIHVLLHA